MQGILTQLRRIINQIDSVVFYRQEASLCQDVLRDFLEKVSKSRLSSPKAKLTAQQNAEIAQVSNFLTLVENIYVNLTNERYPSVSLNWPIEKPMKDVMMNMNMAQMCLSRLDINTRQYLPQVEDLEKDFQSLYGVFSGNSENPRVANKLNSVIRFLTSHHIPIPGAEINIAVEKIFENIQKFKLQQGDFKIEGRLGEGASADVFKGRQLSQDRLVAIKQLKETELDEISLQMFQREISCLSSLTHPSLIEFVGATTTPPYWIVSEYMAGGSLFKRTFTQNREYQLNGAQKTIISFKIAEGMAYLHSKKIIHRDLKSGNILLDKQGEPKIIDFGISRQVDDDFNAHMTMASGTFNYMAPEVISSETYGFPSDVFSYGLVLYELLMTQIPYCDMSDIQIQRAIINNKRPPIPSSMQTPLVDLIKMCWSNAPADRPSFLDILEFFKAKKISFPINSPEEGSKIEQFYAAHGVQINAVNEDLAHIIHTIDRINSQINNVVVYKREILRVRAVLDGYRIQLKNAPFATLSESSFELSSDFDSLLKSLENLENVIKMITQDFWMSVALDWNVMKPKIEIGKYMDEIYISISQLSLKVPKYSPTADDLAIDFKELFDIFAKSGSVDKQIETRLKEVTKFLDENGIKHPPLPPTVDEVISGIFKNIAKFKVEQKQFKREQRIGQGAAGVVFKGSEVKTGRVVAIKELISTELTEYDIESLKREIAALSTLRHPNLVEFVGATATAPYWIITLFMEHKSLFDRLHKVSRNPSGTPPLTPMAKTKIALGIAQGMQYLHHKNMIHRDMKTLNVLLDSNDVPKICDFGISRAVTNDLNMTGVVGTYNYMAPEVIRSTFYTQKADIFSFGMVLWEILCNEVPFARVVPMEIGIKISNGQRPVIPSGCPDELKSLITGCWEEEPDFRPSFDEILSAMKTHLICFPDSPKNEVKELYKSLKIEDEGNDRNGTLTSIDSFCRF